ncbi:MAG: hypothetical protein ABW007_07035 [Chitinophagaceae bacterium]
MKIKAFVPKVSDDEVRWLIIESDEIDTKGYFIYYHINENAAYDTWHKTLDDAFEAAHLQYGIIRESWQSLS